MATISELTDVQFTQLLDEYFAPPVDRSMMTDEEVLDLAKRLNKRISVPIISETREEKILVKIVVKIDRFLYDNLPNEFYDLVRSLDKGIDDTEAKRLIIRLSKLANEKIDIPYIPEQMEYIALRFIIGIIINAGRKHWDMRKSQDSMQETTIPDQKNIEVSQLERLIL